MVRIKPCLIKEIDYYHEIIGDILSIETRCLGILITTKYKVGLKALNITIQSQVLLQKGNSISLIASIIPSTTIEKVKWTSSNETIATVNQDGKVTAISNGKVTITATIGTLTSKCQLSIYSIKEPEGPIINDNEEVKDVTAGIKDNQSKDIIYDMSEKFVNAIAKGESIDESIMDVETVNNIKKALQNGESIYAAVESQVVNKAMVSQNIINTIEESLKRFNDKLTVAQYLDLGIILRTQDKKIGNIYQLDKPIQLTIAIPEDIRGDQRTYYVVRVHNGEATILETKLNIDGTLTFEIDCFSTYALVYRDTTNSSDKVPLQTSDDTSILIYVLLFGCSAWIGGRQIIKRKED